MEIDSVLRILKAGIKALKLCLAKVEFSMKRLTPVTVLTATSIFLLSIFLISRISGISVLILLISVEYVALFGY